MRRGLWLTMAVALTLMSASVAQAAPPGEMVSCKAADGKLAGDDLAVGDLVKDGAAGAVVPPRGITVRAAVLRRDGAEELTLMTEADGTVEVESCGDDFADDEEPEDSPAEADDGPLASISSSPAECVDSEWGWPQSYRWYWPYAWYFKTDTTPAGLSVTNVTNALIEGTQSITGARNTCGMFDNVPAQQRYDGPTNGWANISGDSCLATDWHNVVDFAGGGPLTLAVTCTWEYNGSDAAGSSDMRINDAYNDWMPDGGGTCGGRYVIRSVTAHERGHAYGLTHVPEATHGNLTMSTVIGACSDQEFWLGRGDVIGLRQRYPY